MFDQSASRSAIALLVGTVLLLPQAAGASEVAAPAAAEPASWSSPSEEQLRGLLERFLATGVADAAVRSKAIEVFAADPQRDRLDRVIAAVAVADPRVARLRAVEPPEVFDAADLVWLGEAAAPVAFVADAVRLHVARHLVRCGLFDDAMPIVGSLDVASSVDPATLLFVKASCQHWMLEADAATATIDRLLERGQEIPVRYERLATLMRKDLESLEDDSLDHIARRMRDITRRLSFGRAGPATRSVQDGVIESLDKLIEKLEQQQNDGQGQGGGGAGGAGGGSGAKPMQDSVPAGGLGPGEVTKKDLAVGEGWGKLPPHEREAALQQIGREFPPHYREAIEQYFKRLASGEQSSAPGKAKTP